MNIEDDIVQAEAAVEQKKAEYWIQYGVLLALKQLQERQNAANRNGREISSIEPESGSDSQ